MVAIRKRDADLERELRSDLELEEEEQRDNGVRPEEAHYAARRAFGNATLIKERTREALGLGSFRAFAAGRPVYAPAARTISCIYADSYRHFALSIGASTAVFSILDSVLMRPYAFQDPSQIVVCREVVQETAKEYPSVPDNYRHFVYLRSHAKTIQDAALLQNSRFAITAGGDHPRVAFSSALTGTRTLSSAPNRPGDHAGFRTWHRSAIQRLICLSLSAISFTSSFPVVGSSMLASKPLKLILETFEPVDD